MECDSRSKRASRTHVEGAVGQTRPARVGRRRSHGTGRAGPSTGPRRRLRTRTIFSASVMRWMEMAVANDMSVRSVRQAARRSAFVVRCRERRFLHPAHWPCAACSNPSYRLANPFASRRLRARPRLTAANLLNPHRGFAPTWLGDPLRTSLTVRATASRTCPGTMAIGFDHLSSGTMHLGDVRQFESGCDL